MKSVRISVIGPRLFRKLVKTPRNLSISDNCNIIDLVALLDQEYFQKVQESPQKMKGVFLDDNIQSFLQLIWDPISQRFFEDINLEARTPAPESNSIPIESDWKYCLPNGSWIVIAPEVGS
jgi:hypothetical protein